MSCLFISFRLKTMKIIIQSVLCLLFSIAHSQNSGDILFVAFNADGDKDFAVMAMKDIEANTVVYFTDSEPNALGNGNSDSEGVLKWNSGVSLINAGTVVVFTDVDNASNSNFSSSVGDLTVEDAGFNISSSGDVVYATYGNPVENTVSVWISAIQNSNGGTETNFNATGLSLSSNYVVIDNTASKDGGAYIGVRVGKSITEYQSLIVDEENWTTSTSDGESLLPFDENVFSFESLSFDRISKEDKIIISIKNGAIETNKGVLLGVHNVLGQFVLNRNIKAGVYFIKIEFNGRFINKKVVFD